MHKLLVIRVYEDGSHFKAFRSAWEEVLAEKDAQLVGDTFERDGVKWIAPGCGFEASADTVARLIKAIRSAGCEAEDWSGLGRPEQDPIDRHVGKLAEIGAVRVKTDAEAQLAALEKEEAP